MPLMWCGTAAAKGSTKENAFTEKCGGLPEETAASGKLRTARLIW